ncbi:hypothetical protein Taro_003217 [Colocasia esculenta]|uniref:Uncharacterized protein n=1 Tax=Colocasia esculenta TaxID=4460 RepID=A0A843TEU6_COLES|nr:hypothetical protein [Colocasia esculenta]
MSEGELTSLNDPNLSLSSSEVPEHNSKSSTIPYKILEIDIEKINDRLFSIKVIFERAKGIQAQIQRVTESLGFDLSNTIIHPVDQHKMLSTSFMHVRKQKQLTEESLKKRIIEASLNCGIMVEIDD